jgi:DNA-binding NarL/FixJ family response regulator
MHADDDSLLDAMRAGARGYLLKGAEREEIARAVLTVAAEERSSAATPAVASPPTRLAHPPPAGKLFPELSVREHEVIKHLATGLGNHKIAAHLFLSEKTVRNHLATILVKLQVRDRAAAVARARDRGLGDALR